MSRSSWTLLVLWGLLLGARAFAASPGFVSCGYTLPMGVRVSCNNSTVTISVNRRTWRYRYEGYNPETKIVLSRYLMLSAVNNGSLTFFMTYLFDLRTGQKLFETSMGLLYEDKQRIVLMPSDVGVSWFPYRPEIGIFTKGGRELKMYSYTLKPRPSCGSSEDDVVLPREDHFIGAARGFSFIREDNCGRFVVNEPWPE